MREVRGASDITEEDIELAVEIADGFFGDEPVEWEDLIDRLESWRDADFGSDLNSPAVRKLKRAVRQIRAAS